MNRDPSTFRDAPLGQNPFDPILHRANDWRGPHMDELEPAWNGIKISDPEFDARAAAIKAGPGCIAGCILIAALCVALFTGFAMSPAGEAAADRLELALCGDPV